jgi:hypothetical protein
VFCSYHHTPLVADAHNSLRQWSKSIISDETPQPVKATVEVVTAKVVTVEASISISQLSFHVDQLVLVS